MDTAALIPNPVLGVALATSAMVLFAVCSIATASAMRRLDSDAGAMIAALVNLPLGIVLLLGQLAVFGALRPPGMAGVLGFLLAGVFSTYLGRWLFFKSIEAAGPTRASGFQTSSPLITALLGWVLLGQHLSPLALTGIALGVLGLATTSLGPRWSSTTATTQPFATARRGFLLVGLGSSAAYSVSHILRAGAMQSWSEPVAGVALGAASGTLALVFVNRHRLPQLRHSAAAQPGATALYAAIGCMQVLAQALMIASLAHIPASVAALITMCTPLIVLPASLLLFKNREAIGPFVVLGLAITIGGVALTMLQTR